MKYTDIQKRILDLLADGCPHPRREVWKCLADPQASLKNLAPHIMFIRAKIRSLGQDIVCEVSGRAIFYRHVRFLNGHSPVGTEEQVALLKPRE